MNSNKELRQKYDEMLQERMARSQKGTDDIYGTCGDFCPKFEKIERELKKDISIFESETMVKKYQRSSAGRLRPLPEDIRPLPVLVKVMEHLFSLLERIDQAHLFEVYKFVMDRSRAVRMDMAVQGLEDDQTIYELEKIARFHVVFIYVLFSEPRFELHLHLEQLKKIIVTLLDLYKKRKHHHIHNNSNNEEEFTSYFILLHLKDKDTFSYVQERFMKGNQQIDTSIDIYELYQRDDFYRFLRAFARLDFLSSCVVLASTRDLWTQIAKSCRQSLVESIDLSFFERMLSTDGTKISEIMEVYGIQTTEGKLDFRDKKSIFKEGGYISFSINLEHKRQKSIVNIIKNGPIDLFVRVLIIRSYVSKSILKDCSHDKSVLQNSFNIDTEVLKEIVKEYAARILTSVKQKQYRTEQKKKVNSRKTDGLTGNANSEHKCKLYEKAREKHMSENVSSDSMRLLIVHNKDIYFALFRQKLMKVYSNTLKPQFIPLEKANIDFLLKFSLCIFCVDKEHVDIIERKFFMLNKIVGTAQGLEKKLQNVDEFIHLCHQRKIKKDRLFNVIDGKTPEEAVETIIDLIQNNRNDNKTLEKNLLNIHNEHPLLDCDVYLTDNSEH